MSPKSLNLSHLLGGKTLVLRADNSGKTPYTKEEHTLCQQIVKALLVATGNESLMTNAANVAATEQPEFLGEVLQYTMEHGRNTASVEQLARGMYRARVKAVLAHNEENPDAIIAGIPFERDPTSIQNSLFRGACEFLGVKNIDAIFQKYGAKDKEAV